MADQFSAANFDVTLAGAGPMNLRLQVAQTLNVKLMGSGHIQLAGVYYLIGMEFILKMHNDIYFREYPVSQLYNCWRWCYRRQKYASFHC